MLRRLQLEKLKNFPTPYYLYDLDLLRDTLSAINNEASRFNYHVHYALKANTDQKVLEIIRDAGLGADCVSGNEVQMAIGQKFHLDKIYYAGVGKTDEEIKTGLKYGIGCFNCESEQEIGVVNEIAAGMGKVAKVALRINPDVDSKTHSYITTGIQENKFGIHVWELEKVLKLVNSLQNMELIGLHFHIGSQITKMDVFANLCMRVNEINRWLEEKGFMLPVLNLGGGLGIDYEDPEGKSIPDFKVFFSTINKHLKVRSYQEVHFELGRAVVAQMGSLISKVLYIKNGETRNFAIVDAGMTELIRPALYQSVHKIENLTKSLDIQQDLPSDHIYDVVGPVCETSDFLGKGVALPATERGDLIAVYSTGAYGQSMASNYNLREKAGVVYTDDL